MPRARKQKRQEEEEEEEEEQEDIEIDEHEEIDEDEEEDEQVDPNAPPSIDPYKVLNVSKTATTDEIKSAYRKAALIHHPDKTKEGQKEAATVKFQELAFAYAILSDPARRQRYDTTGSTAESISIDADFKWDEYWRSQMRVTSNQLLSFRQEYVGSAEERKDVLEAYIKGEGNMNKVYSKVFFVCPLDDEERLRVIIDEAIANSEVEAYAKYTGETENQKKRRMDRARREAKEAEELFSQIQKSNREDSLAALIQAKHTGPSNMFDQMANHLEAKYGHGHKGKKPKKKGKKEPTEEEFEALQAKLFGGKAAANGKRSSGAEEGGRKSKRTKH